ncbi:hypothetical protein [Pantoea sp. 18069]|uniref:hypothetical protein n=1 Tax=Pantoea sp. 18069 TaxID=2681415 RepID=UPI00135BEDEA|nr:hypothetical protein [Pantoea sp. 18069]
MPVSPNNTTSTQAKARDQAPVPSSLHLLDIERIFIDGRISEIDVEEDEASIRSLELTYAVREQHPQDPVVLTIPQPHKTHYEITSQACGEYTGADHPPENRESDQVLTPIHLRRTGDPGVPMHLSPRYFPDLDDIAGTAQAHSFSDTFDSRFNFETGIFSHADHSDETLQLSSFNSDYSFLPLASPEFDSTHRVMRIPLQRNESESRPAPVNGVEPLYAEVGDDPLPTESHGAGAITGPQEWVERLSTPFATPHPLAPTHAAASLNPAQHSWNIASPGTQHSEACEENPVNFQSPGYAQTLSLALGSAWQTQTQTPIPPVPDSAPPILHRLPAAQREVQIQQLLEDADADSVSGDTAAVQLVGSQDDLVM